MPLALIVSSYVAGSRVGGFPQALALAAFRIDPVLVPTVLFGRRPGQGVAPGGAAVAAETLSAMLGGVEGLGLLGLADVILTGYFASPAQVEATAEVIDRARAAPREGAYGPRVTVIVDPIMGDEPEGLYVSEAVAQAIETLLAPRADYLTPNLWELRRLSGAEARDASSAARAAQGLGRPVLVTSVPQGDGRIGAVYADADGAWSFAHRFVEGAPHGTGDVVAAIFAAQLIGGLSPREAARLAIAAAAETVYAAEQWRAPELPVVALGVQLAAPTAEVDVVQLA